MHDIMKRGGRACRIDTPDAEEAKKLLFKFNSRIPFITPNFIAHSAKNGGYFSIRSEVGMGGWIADNASNEREWYDLDDMDQVSGQLVPSPELLLLYVGNNLESLTLIADAVKICRPDLIIDCEVQKDWYSEEKIKNIKLNHEVLKPKIGTYILTKEPLTEQETQRITEFEAEIFLLTIGFDQYKLESIISILKSTK
jgi:hypothetical protein